MSSNKNGRRFFWLTVSVLSFLIAAVTLGMAGRTLLAYRSSEKSMQQIYEVMEEHLKYSEPSPSEGTEYFFQTEDSEEETEEKLLSREERQESYQILAGQNSDMSGWIQIPGTVISYPVMHTPEEPDYYFHRDFRQKYSVYGMIYLDGTCRLDGTSPNLLLYGHHMRNGAMFASIEKYSDKSYWETHSEIYFDTLEESGNYEVIAAFRVKGEEINESFLHMLAAQTEEDYDNLMEYIKKNAVYDTGKTAKWPEQLITLTTCEYTQADGRFLVVARKQ